MQCKSSNWTVAHSGWWWITCRPTYIAYVLDLLISELYIISFLVSRPSEHSLDLRCVNVAILVQIYAVKDFPNGRPDLFRFFRGEFYRPSDPSLKTKIEERVRERKTERQTERHTLYRHRNQSSNWVNTGGSSPKHIELGCLLVNSCAWYNGLSVQNERFIRQIKII